MKTLRELMGQEQLIESVDQQVVEVQKHVNDQDHIGEVIFDAILEKAGGEIAHYFSVSEIKLGFDWDEYRKDLNK